MREFYRRRCGLLYGVLALIIVLCVLFAGEEIGMSNNGDFGRVMRAASLDYGQRLPSFTYADAYTIDLSHGSAAANVRAILFGHEGLSRYPSIHVGVVRLSVVANLVLNKLTGWRSAFIACGYWGRSTLYCMRWESDCCYLSSG